MWRRARGEGPRPLSAHEESRGCRSHFGLQTTERDDTWGNERRLAAFSNSFCASVSSQSSQPSQFSLKVINQRKLKAGFMLMCTPELMLYSRPHYSFASKLNSISAQQSIFHLFFHHFATFQTILNHFPKQQLHILVAESEAAATRFFFYYYQVILVSAESCRFFDHKS